MPVERVQVSEQALGLTSRWVDRALGETERELRHSLDGTFFWLAAAFVLVVLSRSADRGARFMVLGCERTAKIVQISGRIYVEAEGHAAVLGGSLAFTGARMYWLYPAL